MATLSESQMGNKNAHIGWVRKREALIYKKLAVLFKELKIELRKNNPKIPRDYHRKPTPF